MVLLKKREESNIMDYDVIDRMVAAFPKKSKKFSNWHEKRFNNAFKLENNDIQIGNVSFDSNKMHYNFCK